MPDRKITLKDMLIDAERAAGAGDSERAATLYAAILARAPGHSKAKKALARLRKGQGASGALSQSDVDQVVALLNSGQFDAVVARCRQLLAIASKQPVLHNIMGMALSNLGRFSDAAKHFRLALRISPDHAEARGNLGTALVELGEFEAAVAELEGATRRKPDLTPAWQALATARGALGQFDSALEAADRALALAPDEPNTLNIKGVILKDMGRFEPAIACYRKGLARAPENTDLLVNLGYALTLAGQDEEAVSTLERALALRPDLAEVRFRLGVQLAQLGRREAALEAHRRAVADAPLLAEAWRSMTTLRTYQGDEPEIAEMERLLQDNADNDHVALHLSFALGKVAEDRGQFDAAFAHWQHGNRLRRAQLDYDPDESDRQADRIMALFDADYIKNYKGFQSDAEPVFVVGMMRSGTTLAERILAAHSKVTGLGELDFVSMEAPKLLDALEAGKADLEGFASAYLALLTARGARAGTRPVDKLPVNFRWLGLLACVFPRASLVAMRRDPRDTCLSIYKNYFETTANQYAYDLDELARFQILHDRMMDHWHRVLPGRVHDCRYEALTEDIKAESQRLLAHCGLEWEPGVLEFHKAGGAVKTASLAQVRRKVYTSSVGGWRRFETGLKPLIERLQEAGRLPADG